MNIKLDSSSSTDSWAVAEGEVAAGELGSGKLRAAVGEREGKLSLLMEGLVRKGGYCGELI